MPTTTEIKKRFDGLEDEQIKAVFDQVFDLTDIAKLTQQQVDNFILVQEWINQNNPDDYSLAKTYWQECQALNQPVAASIPTGDDDALLMQMKLQSISAAQLLESDRGIIDDQFRRDHAKAYTYFLKESVQESINPDQPATAPKPVEVSDLCDGLNLFDQAKALTGKLAQKLIEPQT